MRRRRKDTWTAPAEEREARELYGPDGRRYVEDVEERRVADPDWERGYTETEDRWAEPEPVGHYPGPGQILAIIVGVFFLILGGLALARTGIEDLTAETTVANIPHTGLLGVIEIGFGALLIMAGAAGAAGRGLMAFLGALALAWGVVVVVQPDILSELLAMEQINGWIYLIAGGVIIIGGLFIPTYVSRRRVYHRYDDLP